MRAVVAFCLVVLAGAAVPFGAGAPPPGGGWAIVDVDFDGSMVVFSQGLANGGGGGASGAYMILTYDPQTHVRLGSATLTEHTMNVEGWVEVEGVVVVPRAISTAGPGEHGIFLPLDGTPRPMRFVFLAAGDLSDWHYTVLGSPYTEVARGNEIYYTDGKHFERGVEATVEAGGARIGVSVDRTFSIDVEGVFLGRIGEWAGPFGVNEQTITLEGPHGQSTCPCNPRNVTGLDVMGPGQYVVHRQAVQAEALAPDDVLFGADVLWPRD